jgi:RNA polymerase sigma-70 factor (ECF subfamily)
VTQDNSQAALIKRINKLSESERLEKVAQLVQRRSKLTPEEAALLRYIFPDIVNAHYDLVWNYLRKRGLDNHDAEDLQQEAFMALHIYILEHGFVDNIPGMLILMANGKFRNLVTTKNRSPISYRLVSSSKERPQSSGLSIDRILDHRELAQLIFPKLTQEHQDVIEKVILNELSYSEAAEVLGIPDGTLRSRLMAAKRALFTLAEQTLTPSQRALL